MPLVTEQERLAIENLGVNFQCDYCRLWHSRANCPSCGAGIDYPPPGFVRGMNGELIDVRTP